VARVSWNVDQLRYFTKKGEAVLDPIKPERTEDSLIMSQYRFPGGQAHLRVVIPLGKEGKPDEAKGARLEVLRAGMKNAEVIVKGDILCVPVPAPNGKLVAVRCFTKGKGKDDPGRENLVVVNDKGEVTANLHVQH
jgi:hypothetical protein